MPSQPEITALLKFAKKFATNLTTRPEPSLLPLVSENGQTTIFGDYCLYLFNGDLHIKRIGLDEVTSEAHYSIKYQSSPAEIAIFNDADQQQAPSKIIDADTISDDLSDLEYRKIVALLDRACIPIKVSNRAVFNGLLNATTQNCSDFIRLNVREPEPLRAFAVLNALEEETLRQFSQLHSGINRILETNRQLSQTQSSRNLATTHEPSQIQRPSSGIRSVVTDLIERNNAGLATARTQAGTQAQSSSTPSYATSQTNASVMDFLLSQEESRERARQTTPPPPYSERDPFPRMQNPAAPRNILTTSTTPSARAVLSTSTTPSARAAPSASATSITTNNQPSRRMLPATPRDASRAGTTSYASTVLSTNTTPSAATSRRRPEENSYISRLNSASSQRGADRSGNNN